MPTSMALPTSFAGVPAQTPIVTNPLQATMLKASNIAHVLIEPQGATYHDPATNTQKYFDPSGQPISQLQHLDNTVKNQSAGDPESYHPDFYKIQHPDLTSDPFTTLPAVTAERKRIANLPLKSDPSKRFVDTSTGRLYDTILQNRQANMVKSQAPATPSPSTNALPALTIPPGQQAGVLSGAVPSPAIAGSPALAAPKTSTLPVLQAAPQNLGDKFYTVQHPDLTKDPFTNPNSIPQERMRLANLHVNNDPNHSKFYTAASQSVPVSLGLSNPSRPVTVSQSKSVLSQQQVNSEIARLQERQKILAMPTVIPMPIAGNPHHTIPGPALKDKGRVYGYGSGHYGMPLPNPPATPESSEFIANQQRLQRLQNLQGSSVTSKPITPHAITPPNKTFTADDGVGPAPGGRPRPPMVQRPTPGYSPVRPPLSQSTQGMPSGVHPVMHFNNGYTIYNDATGKEAGAVGPNGKWLSVSQYRAAIGLPPTRVQPRTPNPGPKQSFPLGQRPTPPAYRTAAGPQKVPAPYNPDQHTIGSNFLFSINSLLNAAGDALATPQSRAEVVKGGKIILGGLGAAARTDGAEVMAGARTPQEIAAVDARNPALTAQANAFARYGTDQIIQTLGGMDGPVLTAFKGLAAFNAGDHAGASKIMSTVPGITGRAIHNDPLTAASWALPFALHGISVLKGRIAAATAAGDTATASRLTQLVQGMQKTVDSARATVTQRSTRLNSRGPNFPAKPGNGPADVSAVNNPAQSAPSPALSLSKKKPVSSGYRVEKGDSQPHIQHALNAIDNVHSFDGMKTQVPIKSTTTRHLGNGLEGTYATKPREIEVASDGKSPALATAHEIAHSLDHGGFGPSAGTWASVTSPELSEWRAAVDNSQAIKDLRKAVKTGRISVKTPDGIETRKLNPEMKSYIEDYLLDRREIFARSYAQYIASKSPKGVLSEQLEAEQNSLHGTAYRAQWSNDDFTPIAQAFDRVFKAKGWKE